jgi:hypothetical protein
MQTLGRRGVILVAAACALGIAAGGNTTLKVYDVAAFADHHPIAR